MNHKKKCGYFLSTSMKIYIFSMHGKQTMVYWCLALKCLKKGKVWTLTCVLCCSPRCAVTPRAMITMSSMAAKLPQRTL